ncbi:MAG: hypothetical protein BMS9Abin28_2368 [Anaerolineae bacterium]|nr:MAG: hypothetical protein BMS9Abin28_2368 [Anaerolineae bacterium]
MNLVGYALVVLGTSLMVFSLIPVRKLTQQLPAGNIRRRWTILIALIVLFIVGYLIYGSIARNTFNAPLDLVVPLILFGGAIFVLMSSTISLQTALDVRRIAVLEQESITDSLTGIFNRRYLDRRLEEEVDRSRRYGFPLSVLMLDIDHFKKVNDERGHQFGDLVLNELGRIISKSVRRSDIVARYGGEEILIIAVHTTLSDAAELGERLRRHVETSELGKEASQREGGSIKVTVSIGIADLKDGMNDRQALIEAADGALYQAKSEGRNRVVIADQT